MNVANEAVLPDRRRSSRMVLSRSIVRLVMYLGLALCDVAAIRGAFTMADGIRGGQWMAPNGLELGWIVLPIHIFMAARRGGYSKLALDSLTESIRRGTSAFFLSVCVVALFVFYQHGGLLVSRLAHFTALVSGLLFILIGRALFHLCFIRGRTESLVGRLLIVDGVTPGATTDNVLDARASGIIPDLRNPETLRRMADIIAPYDRVIISTLPDRQQSWAMMLKPYDVSGEILIEPGGMLGAIALSRYLGEDTIVVSRGPMSLPNRIKKRIVDLLIAGVATLLLAPLLIVVAIAIKFDSPGPVLFAQTRVGRSNKWFQIFKFRSMRIETNDASGSRSTQRDDDRITRVGRFIRKTSIDELPQLFNVLKGDMSIVGPRPHALGSLAGDKLFWEVNDQYWTRHALKPGITGLAQVRGFRGATENHADIENRLQADLEYINGWRMWRDISIMLSTLKVLVHAKAY
jgi:exopolysaccharide biosynthesis polyprenyl glycosylphosphotransferase